MDSVACPNLSLRSVQMPSAHHGTFDDICRHGVCEPAACGAKLGLAGGACTSIESRCRAIQHTLFLCVATCHHLCLADLWHDIARLLPETAHEARTALERAQGCNLGVAELVANIVCHGLSTQHHNCLGGRGMSKLKSADYLLQTLAPVPSVHVHT